jgi:hypothetical protein
MKVAMDLVPPIHYPFLPRRVRHGNLRAGLLKCTGPLR